jgi:protein transport protein SEC23
VKINGVIGQCAPLDKKGPSVADQEIGVGGTSAWRLCGLDAATSMAVFLEVCQKQQTRGRDCSTLHALPSRYE